MNIADTLQRADEEDPEAQFKVAECYETGREIEQDMTSAVEYYTRAAKQGHTEAQRRLAAIYLSGKGVKHDPELARMWFQESEK